MNTLPYRLVGLLTVAGLATGCAPRFEVRALQPVLNALPGPTVRFLPLQDPSPNPLHVSTGYVGLFQTRQDISAHPETPPAQVLGAALNGELVRRGFTQPQLGQYEVGCQLGQFLLRYRNYAGAYSATDGWGYLDLNCRVSAAGQTVWEGPIYGRYHQVFYLLFQGFTDAVWPTLSGALVQQVAAALNRNVFHQPAAPQTVQEATQKLASKDADQRFLGAYMLGVTGDPAVIPLLMPYLGDKEKKVRRSVVDALGTLGATSALPTLLSSFDREDGNVKWAILKGILQLGSPEGFAWLQQRAPTITEDTLKEIVNDVLRHTAPLPQ